MTTLRQNSLAVLGGILALLITLSLIGPRFLFYSPYDVDFFHIAEMPNARHWLGTDELGRDILSRIVHGARTSLLIAGAVQLTATCIGAAVGLISGYSRPDIDAVIMTIVDGMYTFPSLVVVLVFVAIAPRGIVSIVIAFTLVSYPLPARLVRSQVISLRNKEFVIAAQALGATAPRILFRHILPNSIGAIIVQFTHGAAGVVMGEAALSYVGIGLPASQPSWGLMIAKGRDYFLSAPHITFFPTLALTLTIICLNGLGELLRMHLDFRLKARLV